MWSATKEKVAEVAQFLGKVNMFLVLATLWSYKRLTKILGEFVKKNFEGRAIPLKTIFGGILAVGAAFAVVYFISNIHLPKFTAPSWLTFDNVALGIIALVLLAGVITIFRPSESSRNSTTETKATAIKTEKSARWKFSFTELLATFVLIAIAFFAWRYPPEKLFERIATRNNPASAPLIDASYKETRGAQPFQIPPKEKVDIATLLKPEIAMLIDTVFREFGADTINIMKRIAYAESGGNQFKDGTVVMNPENNDATGLFQILESKHGDQCRALGYDIKTSEGNALCARHILKSWEGLGAWSASAYRWRDHYKIKPEGWRFDQTPEQKLAAARGEDEIIFVTAPWSPEGTPIVQSDTVYSDNRYICWDDSNAGESFELENNYGEKISPKLGSKGSHFERYPLWVVARSLSTKPIEITFIRSGSDCTNGLKK